ncbi:MAG: hypothetical protein JWN13_3306 [Betaproteobacteria bacterium]|nr:hypothetical protein [Betaproteobacteria bacterium]
MAEYSFKEPRFDNPAAAREHLESIRWPNDPVWENPTFSPNLFPPLLPHQRTSPCEGAICRSPKDGRLRRETLGFPLFV